jgi:hypothetical protein
MSIVALFQITDSKVCWKVSRGHMKAGAVAGTHRWDGKRIIGLKGKRWKAEEVAWVLYYGDSNPPDSVLCKDGNYNNLKKENLVPVYTNEIKKDEWFIEVF